MMVCAKPRRRWAPLARALSAIAVACWLSATAAAAPQAVPEKAEPPGPSDLTESPVKAPISGRVRFPGGIMPAESVQVRLETPNGRLLDQVRADASGFFVFRRVVCGFYVLAVDVAGYAPFRTPLEHSFIPADGMQLVMREAGAESSSVAAIPAGALREYQRGLNHLAKKKFEQGVASLEKAIAAYPRFEEAHSELALFHLERRNLPAARSALERAVQHDEQNARLLSLLGRTARLQGDLTRSIQALAGAVAVAESSWVARWEMAESLSAAARYDEAAPHAARAHELNPGVPAIHQLHYNLLVRRSQYGPALAELDEFLRLFPTHSLATRARQQRTALAARIAESASVAAAAPPKQR